MSCTMQWVKLLFRPILRSNANIQWLLLFFFVSIIGFPLTELANIKFKVSKLTFNKEFCVSRSKSDMCVCGPETFEGCFCGIGTDKLCLHYLRDYLEFYNLDYYPFMHPSGEILISSPHLNTALIERELNLTNRKLEKIDYQNRVFNLIGIAFLIFSFPYLFLNNMKRQS